MTRNTMHRVEVAAPIYDESLKKHVEAIFFDQLRDTAKLRAQQPDGVYVHQAGEGKPFNAQDYFYEQACSGAWAIAKPEQPQEPKPAERELPPVKQQKQPAPVPAAAQPVTVTPKKTGLASLLSRIRRKP